MSKKKDLKKAEKKIKAMKHDAKEKAKEAKKIAANTVDNVAAVKDDLSRKLAQAKD